MKRASETTQRAKDVKAVAPRKNNGKRRTIVLFGLCKPAIFIIVFAHILLFGKALIVIVWPTLIHAAELMDLIAYGLLAVLWVYKVLQFRIAKSDRKLATIVTRDLGSETSASGDNEIVISIDDEGRK